MWSLVWGNYFAQYGVHYNLIILTEIIVFAGIYHQNNVSFSSWFHCFQCKIFLLRNLVPMIDKNRHLLFVIGIYSCDRKYLPLKRFFIVFAETSSCNWNCLLYLTGNVKFNLVQSISSCGKKLIPVSWNFFFWQYTCSCDRKLIPVTINSFLWQQIVTA